MTAPSAGQFNSPYSVAPLRIARSVLPLLSALGLAGMILAWRTPLLEWASAYPFILVASTSYVLIALLGGSVHTWCGRLITLALAFCWLGDMLGPRWYVTGAVMFLIAHLLLVWAFLLRGVAWPRLGVGFIITCVVSACSYAWIARSVPQDQEVLVAAYVIVISAMTVAAFASVDGEARWIILAGAVCFYVSDLFVARNTYVHRSGWNMVIGYPIYYSSCILFAFSAAAQYREHIARAPVRYSG